TMDNVLDGFLARSVIFTGSAEPQAMKQSTPELARRRDDLIEHARAFYNKAGLLDSLDMDDSVLGLAWSLEQEWMNSAAQSSRPDAAGPTLKRLSESVLKVAGLLAIDEAVPGETPKLTANHFDQARRLGLRWISSTLMLIDALGRTTFQKSCEAVLSTIRANPDGMRVRDVYRKHRKLDNRQFSEVLTAL